MPTLTTVPRSGRSNSRRAVTCTVRLNTIIFFSTLGRNPITSCRRTSCGLVIGMSIQSNHDIYVAISTSSVVEKRSQSPISHQREVRNRVSIRAGRETLHLTFSSEPRCFFATTCIRHFSKTCFPPGPAFASSCHKVEWC